MIMPPKKTNTPIARHIQKPVLQKAASRGPAAPPVYRPQPVPKVLQTKRPAGQTAQGPAPRQPVGPPVYKPDVKRIVQPMIAQTKRLAFQPQPNAPRLAAPVVRPANGIIQRVRVQVPAGVVLPGGNGVSVVWKKGQQDLPHVTLSHGPRDAKDRINVSNIHYKANAATYFHWDDKDGSTTLTFRGGEPSKKIYDRTQAQAARFGLTLQKPQSVVTEEAALALQEQQRQQRLRQEAEEERQRQVAAAAAEEAELRWERERERREGKQVEQVQPAAVAEEEDWETLAAKSGIQ